MINSDAIWQNVRRTSEYPCSLIKLIHVHVCGVCVFQCRAAAVRWWRRLPGPRCRTQVTSRPPSPAWMPPTASTSRMTSPTLVPLTAPVTATSSRPYPASTGCHWRRTWTRGTTSTLTSCWRPHPSCTWRPGTTTAAPPTASTTWEPTLCWPTWRPATTCGPATPAEVDTCSVRASQLFLASCFTSGSRSDVYRLTCKYNSSVVFQFYWHVWVFWCSYPVQDWIENSVFFNLS